MGGEHIFCYNCIHFDNINLCKTRHQFIRPQKARYCHDFVDRTKILKPKEEIPQLAKPLEEVPIAPVEIKLEVKSEIKVKKLTWWQKIIKFLLFWRKNE
jgi:hypothetical protein